ncbi:NAD(P)-dependent oxidoreductase [Phenylobacterium sp.]|uniref:NAD-dependent epimerase/dehydratase family protein n=1 Tax=Phenylobacterium sp. TaxID=1871053 RepID=UPI0011F80CC6|nr:NAD(P)-dependent oxidoreductase [Phenylobacterium sp.]THD58898.1 MAG: NAD(P)-dependent oxidoreductase [Phenylobacterium sp.]
MTGLATIIGATGFVGRRLQARLTGEGWDVYAPAKGDTSLFGRDMGVVFYCAGLTADYDRRPFDTVEAHVTLLSALIQAGRFEQLIYLSSTRLYDGQAARLLDEAAPLLFDPTDPRRIYDLSKALGENLTLTRTDGRGAVARLSNVFDWEAEAPGFLSEWLIEAARTRALNLDSSPHIARDYIHLDDVVAALVAMAEKPAHGVVNVASGETMANGEIANLFLQAGWQVSFARDVSPLSPPTADVGRLRALGVDPAPVKDVVRRYLEGLKA